MFIKSVMPSSHLILCRPLLLLPSIFSSIRVFSNESALHIRWPKYCSFSFSISPFNEHPGLISFSMDWLDLLACSPRDSQESSPTLQFKSMNSSAFSFPLLCSTCLFLFVKVYNMRWWGHGKPKYNLIQGDQENSKQMTHELSLEYEENSISLSVLI